MKVFEVVTEDYQGKEITNIIQYVTADDNSLATVAEHFSGYKPKSIREVLTVTERIECK